MKCEDCGEDKDTAIMRAIDRNAGKKDAPAIYPSLCHECCAKYPGREWMRSK